MRIMKFAAALALTLLAAAALSGCIVRIEDDYPPGEHPGGGPPPGRGWRK